jgi:hypothetical protein
MKLVDKTQVLSVIQKEIIPFSNTYTRDALTHVFTKINELPEVKECATTTTEDTKALPPPPPAVYQGE